MGLTIFVRIGVLFVLLGLTRAQEDSLRSALNAVDRRQRDLSEFPRYDDENYNDYGNSLEGPDDLAFLSQPQTNYPVDVSRNPAFTRLLLDYLEDTYEPKGYNEQKRISSSFRERLEEDKERQLEEFARSYLTNAENARDNDNEDYSELIRELWEKYKNYPISYNRPRVFNNKETYKKRSYYPRLGLDSAGLRKRSKYEPDAINDAQFNYPPTATNDDLFEKFAEDESPDFDYDWNKNRHYRRDRKYDTRPRYNNYPMAKRFPVSKRSSNFNPEFTHEYKRSTTKRENVVKTDPKVAKDLSNIFGTNSEALAATTKPEKPLNKNSKKELAKESKSKTKTTKPNNKKIVSKEEVSSAGLFSYKPLQVKKKSINWSDYVGLDRRKKSDEDLDKQWLIERYHKAIALTNKRNAEYPLQSFKNHDQPAKKILSTTEEPYNKKKDLTPEESKISDMDARLKTMEETIIDDALKYTGAHEGTADSQEIQEVKDRVISRLAAAYSLEKMRRALGEYKVSMSKERDRLKQQDQKTDDYDLSEEKRVSVPRKQAVDDEREKVPEADNNIKCSQGDEECEEQNYQTPSEVLEQAAFEECPKVQRACNEVATILGHYARVFETACNMHQMCLLCSNNSWFAPTRQCNVLFLSKAFELCDGKAECQKEAQRSVRYLLDVNRSLRLEPSGECELACPDSR